VVAAFSPCAVLVDASVSLLDCHPFLTRVTSLIGLTKRADFLKAASARRWQCSFFVARVRERESKNAHSLPDVKDLHVKGLRLGLTVTKKMGNAPQRNRIRRRLKGILSELCLHKMSSFPPVDVVIMARDRILHASHCALRKDLERLLQQVHPPETSHKAARLRANEGL
jgi:ribonuclease P protein component